MPIRVEDVVKIDALKEELHDGLQQLGRTLRHVFGELSFGLITVVDRHNALETQVTALQTEQEALKGQVSTLAERLLQVEQRLRGPH